MWSDYANGHIYQFVGLILQTAEAYNIIVGGGSKYSVPSGNLSFPSVPATQNLTSYALSAIAGADDLDGDSVTVRDVFSTIVDITREITLTCEFPVIRSFYSPVPESSWNRLDSWVRANVDISRETHSDDSSSRHSAYGWPVRSVERLPPFSPKQLRHPVLVIGNTVRASHSDPNCLIA